MPFVCGAHRAYIYERGGVVPVGEVEPLASVRWQRIRDDISRAEVTLPPTNCCELLGDLRTVLHELHIERNGEIVWQGPITRLEYEWDLVRIFAEDVLWQAKRTVITEAYDQSHPNIWLVIDRMDWLLRGQCYALHGDPWNVVSHLHPVRHPAEPRTSRKLEQYQFYVWEDFDKYAEDNGTDYTVVNRDIYYFDNHLAWKIIPPLDDQFISQFPRVVEYGNDLATRGYVTNGKGDAGIANGTQEMIDLYGWVDFLVTNQGDAQQDADAPATPEEIAGWTETAAHNIDGKAPSPVAVIVPANTTLLPGAPWTMDDLVPGAWFEVSVNSLCRTVTQWQRLHEIAVEEAEDGEHVNFTAVSPPVQMVLP